MSARPWIEWHGMRPTGATAFRSPSPRSAPTRPRHLSPGGYGSRSRTFATAGCTHTHLPMKTTSMSTRMTTVTRTATSTDGRLTLRVAQRGLVEARGHVPLAARTVHGRPGWTRVVLVQTSAGPLAGDRIEIDVEIEAGAALELTPTAATLAYP